jgi:hypothetical protein
MEMIKNFVLRASLVLAVSTTAASAQETVAVKCKVEDGDMVGTRLCSAVKDDLARNPRFHYLADPTFSMVVIHIVTTKESDYMSADAVAYTSQTGPGTENLLSLIAALTGGNKVDETASAIVAGLDSATGQ